MTDLAHRRALLVIDLQVGMMDGVAFSPLVGHDVVMANVLALISKARERDEPVIFVRHDGRPQEALAPGSPGWPLDPRLGRRDNEPIISKSVGDAFARSDLEARLRALDVREVVLAGAQTDQCVRDTLGGALAAGFAATVAADAHATWDWNGETAAQIVERHNLEFQTAGAKVAKTLSLIGPKTTTSVTRSQKRRP